MRSLIYVSNNVLLPNGKLNPFFLQEKEALGRRYGEFSVVCPKGFYRCSGSSDLIQQYQSTVWTRIAGILSGVTDGQLYRELLHMLKDKKITPVNVAKIVRFSIKSAVMYRLLEKVYRSQQHDELTVYSYWLDYDAYAVAKLKKKHSEFRAIARAHAYEIQPARNKCVSYMMKREICAQLDTIAFISREALNAFLSYCLPVKENLQVTYLGSKSIDTGAVHRTEDGVLTIITCSAVIPLKQLDWVVHVLRNWHCDPVKWIHIGDGPYMNAIKKLIADAKLPDCVSCEFLGEVDNAKVRARLLQADVDVFVNMSKSEGVPVSIMEAMSFGVPIVAPRINGIPELVDSECGILFEAKEGPGALEAAILQFAKLSASEKCNMGKAAYLKWEKQFRLEKNLMDFL